MKHFMLIMIHILLLNSKLHFTVQLLLKKQNQYVMHLNEAKKLSSLPEKPLIYFIHGETPEATKTFGKLIVSGAKGYSE
jgi:hypothetical protein